MNKSEFGIADLKEKVFALLKKKVLKGKKKTGLKGIGQGGRSNFTGDEY